MTPAKTPARARARTLAVTTLVATAALVLPVVAGPAAAATVSASQTSPAQLLRQDLERAAAGSTVQLRPGLTSGITLKDLRVRPGVVLRGVNGSVDSVTLKGVSGGLSLSQFTVSGPVVISRSADVTLTRSRVFAGVKVRDGSVRTTVRGNTISGGRVGIGSFSRPGTARQRGLLIEGNDVYGQTGDNIQLGPSDDVVIRGNRLRDLQLNSAHNDGVQAMDVRGLLIAGNRFTNQDQAVLLKPERDVFPGAHMSGAVVRDNLVVDSRGAGFILVNTSGAQVHNNTFSGNRHADVHLEGQNVALAVRRNVGDKLWVTRGARRPAVQSENCFRYGTLTATDRRAAPQFQDRARFLLTAASPCRSADRTPWGWSAPTA